MFRSHVTPLTLILCGLVAGLGGCDTGSSIEDDQAEVEVQDDAKSDAAFSVVGVWINEAPADGELALLELRSSKDFLLSYAASDSREGIYKITRSNSGKTKYLRLTQAGALLVRYAFTLGKSSLQLRDTATNQTFLLKRQPPGTARLGTPSFIAGGMVVQGPDSYVPAGDGKECALQSVHCVTKDRSACPLVQPLPSDFCAE